MSVFDAVVVGAGFAGLYMHHRLRGLGLTVRTYEAGAGVGGTWFWNRYPGARCDVESLEYSYSFSDELEKEWRWTERYASQPEILRYLNHVAERFDLQRHIRFGTRVTAAIFDDDRVRWIVRTDHGDEVAARFCIMATGCLSAANVPGFKGLESFRGRTYHTGNWPPDGVDFIGRRVAVVGTGSSAVQSIPIIAKQASHLFVFQRTPNFSVPAHNGPLTPQVVTDWDAHRAEYRRRARTSSSGMLTAPDGASALDVTPAERDRIYERRWQRGGLGFSAAFEDITVNSAANETAAEFVRSKIRAIVRDRAVAEKLVPRDFPLGTKRLCVDTGYYATFNRENVTLVDVRSAPIEAITPSGIQTSDAEYAVDSIVFATGFDAMTGALRKIDIRGRGGLTLERKWVQGPRTYLGLMAAGFPNLFLVTGPGSPSVLSNMIVSIEQHVDWIADCLAYLRRHRVASIEPTVDAENAWVAHAKQVADHTLYPRADSWYMGANIPGKPRGLLAYVGGVGAYRRKCDDVAAGGYEGFALQPVPAAP